MADKEILERLEKIEARAEKATPGPWEWDEGVLIAADEREIMEWEPECMQWKDMEFIAHSREDVPWLCKTVWQLVARLEGVEAQCAAMQEALEEISRTEPDEKPDGTILGYLVHDAYEMCGIANAALRHEAGRDFLDRLRKLERVAEAAREVVRGSTVESKQPDGWERCCVWGPQWEHLAKSLAALEEVEG